MGTETTRRKAGASLSDRTAPENSPIVRDVLSPSSKSARIDETFTRFIIVLSVLVLSIALLLSLFPDNFLAVKLLGVTDAVMIHLGLCSKVYAIVLDAGSTGSRVLGFTFHENPVTNSLHLADELWREVKPGLSSFADNPEEGANTIAQLLEHAKAFVPESERKRTPISLKATAGLRMLPMEKADMLINLVGNVLNNSGFDNRGVEIMSELHEGLYGWVTVNYLLNQLDSVRYSYVALDLGGGSTQITFAPKYDQTFQDTPSDFLHHVSVIRKKRTIYSHSYLGLGLMAARESIFTSGNGNSSLLKSPCMAANQPVPWEFHNKHYTVQADNPGYELCMIQVMEVINSLKVHQSEEVPTRKIAAFSYFYDRAVDAGILKPGESKVVQVQEFLDAAALACNSESIATENPFLCVDLVFISTLLNHGYRLDADAKLGLYKSIDGHQTSWGLGAAFAMLEKE